MTPMDAARAALKEVFGYDDFRPGQEDAVAAILRGRDVMAVMPTGAGKSICYQIPALVLEGVTLVVSPLISLMRDQVFSLLQNGVRAAYLNSSLTPRQYALALENARRNGVRLDVRTGDLFAPLGAQERFDLIVSNPPYLTHAELEAPQLELTFEPRLALDGGADGLVFYRRIAAEYAAHLAEDGALLVEIGAAQAEAVSALLGGAELMRDLAGRPRALLAARQGEGTGDLCWKN